MAQQEELCSVLCPALHHSLSLHHSVSRGLSLHFCLTSEGRRVRQLSENTLLIEKVKREDAGTYLCQAQIRGRPIYQQLSVSVVVNGQFLFHIKIK